MEYQKYLKYKNKYLKLKLQYGGQYRILSDGIRKIIFETRPEAIQLELKLNKAPSGLITKERLSELGDLLFYEKYPVDIKVTPQEIDFISELLNKPSLPVLEVPKLKLLPVTPIIQKPTEIIKKEEGSLKLLGKLNLNIGYLTNTSLWQEKRLREIMDYFEKYQNKKITLQEAMEIFQSEKNKTNESLIKLDSKLKVTDLTIKYDPSYKPSGIEGHHLLGKYFDKEEGKTYIYKEIKTLSKKIELEDYSAQIQKSIEFVESCRKIYFKESSDGVTVEFVKVSPKLIISDKDSETVLIGYLMEEVKGMTVRKFRQINEEEYESTILPAIQKLIDELTDREFLIIDFALDNIMWDPETKTLTYIDISERSFEEPDKARAENMYVKYMPYY